MDKRPASRKRKLPDVKKQTKNKRWVRRAEERAPEILQSALECFAEKGFAATRMEDIAHRAGISKGTVYLYFVSKEEVFKALVQEAVGQRIGGAAMEIETFEGRSADLLRIMLKKVGAMMGSGEQMVLPRLVLAEAGNFPELAEHWRREVLDRGAGLWEAIIRRGQERGEFRALDPYHVARLCMAPLITAALWRSVFGKSFRSADDHQAFIDIHIDILLRGLAQEDKT